MDNLPSIQRFNDNAIAFTVGARTWYWSYNTCVAYEDLQYRHHNKVTADIIAPKRVRVDRNPSITSAKHMRYMGVADWPRVDDETFERLATGGTS